MKNIKRSLLLVISMNFGVVQCDSQNFGDLQNEHLIV